jgi:hypothetical protein
VRDRPVERRQRRVQHGIDERERQQDEERAGERDKFDGPPGMTGTLQAQPSVERDFEDLH